MQRGQTKNGAAMTVAACLWLGLFPLLQGGSYSRITKDKWLIMLALSVVTVLCLVIDGLRRRLARPRKDLLILGAALLGWILISNWVSPLGPAQWWMGTSARREGLATQLCYLGLFFAFSFSRVRKEPVLLSAGAGVLLFAAVVLLQRAGHNPLGLYPAGRSYATNYEFQGTIGNIDMDTGYLLIMAGLFTAPVLQGLLPRPDRQARLLLFLLPLAVAFFLILTMGVQFGVLTLGALAAVLALVFLPKKARVPVLILLIILALAVVWFWPSSGGGLWELHEILHGRMRLSFGSNRVAVWLYSLRLAGEQWLFGGGSDTFSLRFNQYLKANDLHIPTEQDGVILPSYFDNPHSEYLAQLVNHGLPALLLMAVLILAALIWKRREEKSFPVSPWRLAVFCYAVQAMLSFSVPVHSPMFWVVLGLCAGSSWIGSGPPAEKADEKAHGQTGPDAE